MKLYVEEPGRAAVVARVEQADAVATARIAYPEARAALARHRREGALSLANLRQIVRSLDQEWSSYNIVDITEALVRLAGALAERHALRGSDAVHLAAALDIWAEGGPVQFLSFDASLNRAAFRERLSAPDLRA